MSLNLNSFYHPFLNSTFGLLLKDELKQANVTDGEIVDEINLYYQPLEKPSIVITFFVLKLLVICIGEWVCANLLTRLKKEKGLLTDTTKFLIVSQMILHPILVCFDLVINTIYPVNEIVGDWFCFLDWLLWGIFMRVWLSNSFIAALMRYLFIVHEEKVNTYGKEKVKRWFLYLSITIPIIQFSLRALNGGSKLSFVKKCYGNDHRAFLIETSLLDTFKQKFVTLDGPFVDIDTLREIALRVCRIIEGSLFLLMGSNIAEIFFYFKILTKLDR